MQTWHSLFFSPLCDPLASPTPATSTCGTRPPAAIRPPHRAAAVQRSIHTRHSLPLRGHLVVLDLPCSRSSLLSLLPAPAILQEHRTLSRPFHLPETLCTSAKPFGQPAPNPRSFRPPLSSPPLPPPPSPPYSLHATKSIDAIHHVRQSAEQVPSTSIDLHAIEIHASSRRPSPVLISQLAVPASVRRRLL